MKNAVQLTPDVPAVLTFYAPPSSTPITNREDEKQGETIFTTQKKTLGSGGRHAEAK
jgi:hypothetical protein